MNNSTHGTSGKSETIVIVGAGACGLMAARELSAAGREVVVLEAGDHAGGRIRTLKGDGFRSPVEAGAEFVHGQLPLTLELLQAAGISFHPVKGKMANVRKGKWGGQGEVRGGWGELMEKMRQLGEDMPLSLFLSTRFHGEKYAGLRESVRRFAQGFDLADIQTVSTMALYKEWSGDEEGQYRIEGGYGALIDSLAGDCLRAGCKIYLSSPVTKITWEPGVVTLATERGRQFTGAKAIVTVPLGLLQASYALPNKGTSARNSEAIRFMPGIGDHLQAVGRMGYGTVIKILLQFSSCFWNKKEKKLGFVISDETIPTWWTQFPDDNPLLTAWIPGALKPKPGGIGGEGISKDASWTELCLSSLANIFDMDTAALRQQLVAVKVVDWAEEPFIRGGYSFETVESAAARSLLTQPIRDTLYFAGEGLYEGGSPGTVEAALDNGRKTAEKIIRHIDRAKS